MLMVYRSLSSTNTLMYQALSSAGSLPCASLQTLFSHAVSGSTIKFHVGWDQQHIQGTRAAGLLDVRLQHHVVVHQALVVTVLDRSHAFDVLH
jgi:hypothetical protein